METTILRSGAGKTESAKLVMSYVAEVPLLQPRELNLLYRDNIGIMENNMETTIGFRV